MAQERKNKFRTPEVQEPAAEEPVMEATEPPKKPKKNPSKNSDQESKNTEPGLLARFKSFFSNSQHQQISGLVVLFFVGYCLAANASYMLYWTDDQNVVNLPWTDFFSSTVTVENKLGKLGALWAHVLLYKTFGLASFFILYALARWGLSLFFQRFYKSIGFYFKMLAFTVWFSLVLSFIFFERIDFLNGALGGAYGYVWSSICTRYTGDIGFPAVLLFILLLYLFQSKLIRLPQKPLPPTSEPIPNPPSQNLPTETPENEVAINNDASLEASLTENKLVEEHPELLDFTIIRKEEPVLEPEIAIPASELPSHTKPESDKKPEIPLSNEPDFIIQNPLQETEVLLEENKAADLVSKYGEYDPTLDLGSYTFPDFNLLNDYGTISSKVNQDELVANKNKISTTLKNYGIEIDKISATVGPTVTLYEIVPAAGVRISKIKNLEDDIALSLSALGIRIIAPIPGKGTIGIEVPNQTPEMVPMKNILASEKFNNTQFELPIALGKTISNEVFITDLAKMPHLLMAGATGQGKSVGLNAVLVSLLYKKHPAQVKFVLIDPKKVELTLFNKIERHFLAKLPNSEEAIIIDTTKVIHTLNSLCIEMDNRYALLSDAQVRDLKSYNTKFIQRKLNPNDGHKFLPYIVVVIDEFADLIMTAGKEVETPIARLAQLARAIGIHLIIATQRPSVNIITGTIKANFPARIAFRVTSKIDSRTILDSGGAEQLIGRGDLLLSTGNDIIRIQCAFVDTPEVEKITEFIGSQRAYPSAFLLPEYVGEDGDSNIDDIDLSERDKMFDEAAKLVVQFQQGSASFLQRKLKLGYNRAGRIVDQLEAAGIIGPFEGSKARDVLIKDMVQLEEILQKLKNK